MHGTVTKRGATDPTHALLGPHPALASATPIFPGGIATILPSGPVKPTAPSGIGTIRLNLAALWRLWE